ncbi:MAG TPA: hypothetical protein VH879_05840 [Gemmatimonadales bacterium]|jgi:hypothetical protein
MPKASSVPVVVTLRSALATVDAQLASGTLPPERVEDIKSAIDDIRFRLWGVLTATSSGEYQAFRERFRLRRAAEICNGLAQEFADGRLASGHREVTDLREAVEHLARSLPRA